MAVTVTHSTVATLADEPGAEVNKAEWNAAHTVVGLGSAAEAATTDFDAAGAATAAVAAHEAALDPHPQYLTAAEGNAAYDAIGAASAAVAIHEAAADPHTGYQKESEKDAANGYAGLDINGRLTLAKLVDIATARLLGRVTAGAGVVEELTGTQATTLLDVFTSLLKGLVPASGGGTTTFLRADGTFAAPTASAADPVYAPGSFTVATESGRYIPKRVKLTTTQRATLQGTGRLLLTN